MSRVACFGLFLSLCGVVAQAQEINIYSEFQRFGPLGNVVRQDYEPNPRELLSPAVPRNGHLTVRVVVNAPPPTNFFIYAGSNPPDVLKITIYREHFAPCGMDYCPDWLTEVHSPTFGAVPESINWLNNQNTRSYIFDIWVPPNVPPRRVRIEALLKTGTWMVAPLEVRVIEPTVPSSANLPHVRDIADRTEPASVTAHRQFLRWMGGAPPEMPPSILRVNDLIQRNAAEDMLLAEAMGLRTQPMNFMAWTPFLFPQTGPEWYLRVRDYIYRFKR
ncbi:MAG TPA: hypothetical protein VNH18_26420 [Bryobacteraceae bacterium]|nr:hypothetical protein [Bryobacteraceae bacterium]